MYKLVVTIFLITLPLVCSAQRPSLRDLQQQGSYNNEENSRRNTYNVPTAGYDFFSFEKFGIVLEYPKSWIKSNIVESFNEGADIMGVQIDRLSDFHAPRISITWHDYKYYEAVGNRDKTIDKIFEEKFKDIEEYEYESLHEEANMSLRYKDRTTINGRSALRFGFDASLNDGRYQARDEWVYIDFDGFVVEFSYQATPENFTIYYDKFTHIIDSFTITTPEVEYKEPEKKEVQQIPLHMTQFSDVPPDAWYASDLLDARMAGWVSGYQDKHGNPLNTFGPADPVTVAEMLKMIMTAKILLPNAMADQAAEQQVINHWSNEFVAEALARKIIPSSLQGLILNSPDKPITRAETAEMTYAFFPIDSMNQDENDPKFNGVFLDEVPNLTDITNHQYQQSIYSLVRVGIFTGDTNASGATTGNFRPNDTLNRAEALIIAARAGDRNCLFLTNVCPHNITEE